MNKTNMGKFLKELRESKKLTMNKLIEELNKEHLGVTIKSISDWESGTSIPELEKLVFLSNFYDVSIDEILEGERKTSFEDIDKRYPIFSKEFDKLSFNNDEQNRKLWFETRTKYVGLMNKNFKNLLFKFYKEGLSHNEELELNYIFKHKCKLSDYYNECYKKLSADEYVNFSYVMRDLKRNPKISSTNEFYWELQKYFDVEGKFKTSINFYDIMDEEPFKGNEFISVLLKQSETWELDMLISGFQKFDPICIDSASNSKFLERYETIRGKKFDREAIYKETLKFVIQQGGKLNPYFNSFIEKKTKKHQIIDRLEELYKLCLRPIQIYKIDDEREGFQKRYFVDNTPYNRFLADYYKYRSCITLTNDESIDVDAVHSLLTNDPNNKKFIEFVSKLRNIDTNREERFVLADLSFEITHWNKTKQEYFDNENRIQEGLEEIKKLESMLNNGETEYSECVYEEIGPKSNGDIKSWIVFLKKNLSFKDFNKWRNEQLTHELMDEIDSLSIEEIRKKYFAKEIVEGGECHD